MPTRASPDVSAQARKFQIVWQGQRILIRGTSAVTPTLAGLVALLNDARLAAPRSGFSIPCCINAARTLTKRSSTARILGECGTPGFKATEGWDPVTGPDFKKLMKVDLD
ncbi:hypothetical protein B0H14DRAFT_3453421 [Mycena olivaceomarginata]|nr:hypothetical protein B0H14DRAFT_3453421 [Mycena olivaceomarginata]